MPRTVPVHPAARGVSPPGARRWSTLTTMLSDDQAVHVLRALDALDELEAAAFKLVRAELACGPVIDGLIDQFVDLGKAGRMESNNKK